MASERFDEPANEIDRRIYHILSHGQKRRKEILSLLSTARQGKSSKENRIRELSESYAWADKIEEDHTYYYRKDVGRQPEMTKPPVDYSEMEAILSDLEIKLGIKSQNESLGGSQSPPPIPTILNNLLKLSNYNGKILTNMNHFERFFDVFDKMVEETENAYSSEGPPPNYPEKTHGLFYTIVAQQHECWKKGNSHEEFDKEIRRRIGKLKMLLNIVPPEIGNQIMRILSIVDVQRAREGFEIIVYSNKYTTDELITHGESCYVIWNDVDDLKKNLNRIQVDCEEDGLKEKIHTIKKVLRYQM